MRYRRVLNRRTFIRGAGSVAIALPFLDEMRPTSVYAADPPPPPRVLTMFFALGVPAPFQADQFARPYTGHMAPLAQIADKVSLLRGVHYEKGSRSSGNHARGSETAFIGGRTSGASIDQVVLQHLHGNNAPTPVRSLVAGTYTRQDGNARHIHSWVGPDQPTAQPIESPRELFDRAFGSFMPPDPGGGGDPGGGVNPAAARRARYERSILDSALEHYNYVTSDAYGLSNASRARLRLHMEHLRELEQRVFDPAAPAPPPVNSAGCPPARPPEYTHPEMVEIQKTVNNEDVRMEVNRWMELWHTMADVYAMAVKCDITRFGHLMFQSAGERILLYGDYQAYGQTRTFDDPQTTHDFWHGWRPGNSDERRMIDHLWLYMAEVTYFLKALDDPEYRDANGGTILDNALVLVTTELGDGGQHNVEDVFHLVNGANDRIRTGQVIDVDAQATELYNAGLRAVGVNDISMSGDRDYAGRVLDAVLV